MERLLSEYPLVAIAIIFAGAYFLIAYRMKKARKAGENPVKFWDWVLNKHHR